MVLIANIKNKKIFKCILNKKNILKNNHYHSINYVIYPNTKNYSYSLVQLTRNDIKLKKKTKTKALMSCHLSLR
jgi:hypothetical protein